MEEYISIEMLNTLENLMCRKITFLGRDFSGTLDLWSVPIQYCKTIEQSPLLVNTVVKEVLQNNNLSIGSSIYRKYHVILARTYILLYYKHRDEDAYQAAVFGTLISDMGPYGDTHLNDINQKIDEIKNMEDIVNGKKTDYHNPIRLELLLRFMDIPEEVRKKSGNNKALARIMNIITGIPISTCESYPSKRDLNKDYHKETLKKIDLDLEILKPSIRFLKPNEMDKEKSCETNVVNNE